MKQLWYSSIHCHRGLFAVALWLTTHASLSELFVDALLLGSSLTSPWISGERIASYDHYSNPTFMGCHSLRSDDCDSSSVSSVLMMGLRGKKIRREKRRARQESKTPPRIQTPYGPIRLNRNESPTRTCDYCGGRGMVRCSVCQGNGVIRATGQRKRNSINLQDLNRLIGSQWTSVEIYNGHRHHTVKEIQGSKKQKTLKVRMQNCCGDQQDFWIPIDELRDKTVWRMGWLTLQDIRDADGGPLRDVRVCFRCKGERILLCVDCDGKGNIPNYEPLYD